MPRKTAERGTGAGAGAGASMRPRPDAAENALGSIYDYQGYSQLQ